MHLVCFPLRFNRSKDPGGATPPPSTATTADAPPRGLAVADAEPEAAVIPLVAPAPDISVAVPAVPFNLGTGRRPSVATIPPRKWGAIPPPLLEVVTATARPPAATLCPLLPLQLASAVASVEDRSADSSLGRSVAADAAVVVIPVVELLLLLFSAGTDESTPPLPAALPLPLFVFVVVAAVAVVAGEKQLAWCVALRPCCAHPSPLPRSPTLTPPLEVEDVLVQVINFSARPALCPGLEGQQVFCCFPAEVAVTTTVFVRLPVVDLFLSTFAAVPEVFPTD